MLRILTSRRATGGLVVLMMATAGALAVDAGRPSPLPSASLDSVALLYAERAAALFAIFLLVASVAQRAFAEGRLPDEISDRGVKYADRATVSEIKGTTQDAIAATERVLARTRSELRTLQRAVRQLQSQSSAPNDN